MTDPLAKLRAYLDAGGNLREAERLSGVPRSTLHFWLTHGEPPSVVQWNKLLKAAKLLKLKPTKETNP